MRLLAAALLMATAPLAACRYDGPNPWDTEDDVEELEYKTERDLELAMRSVWPNPQTAPDPLLDPDLEGWRRTVLPNADRPTLARAEEQSRAKIGALETRIRSLMRTDEHNRKEVLTPLVFHWRIEKARLGLLQDRLKQLQLGG